MGNKNTKNQIIDRSGIPDDKLIVVNIPEDDYYENAPALWIVYDDDSGSIMGHATNREDAVELAEQLSDVRILKARL